MKVPTLRPILPQPNDPRARIAESLRAIAAELLRQRHHGYAEMAVVLARAVETGELDGSNTNERKD